MSFNFSNFLNFFNFRKYNMSSLEKSKQWISVLIFVQKYYSGANSLCVVGFFILKEHKKMGYALIVLKVIAQMCLLCENILIP